MPHPHYLHTTTGRAHKPSILDTHPHIQLSRAGRYGRFRQSSSSSSSSSLHRNTTGAGSRRHFDSLSNWRTGNDRPRIAGRERDLVQPGDIFWLRVGLSEAIMYTVEALLEPSSDNPPVNGATPSRTTSILHRDIARLHLLDAGRSTMKLRPGIILDIRYPSEKDEEAASGEPMVEIMPFGTVEGTPRTAWDELFAFFAVPIESDADFLRPFQHVSNSQSAFNWHASADGGELEWEDAPPRWTFSQGQQPWEEQEEQPQRIKKVDEEYVIRFNKPWSGPWGDGSGNDGKKTLSSWAAGQTVWVPLSSLVPDNQREHTNANTKVDTPSTAWREGKDKRKGRRRFDEETSERYTGTLADILSVGTEQPTHSKGNTPVPSGTGTPATSRSGASSPAPSKSTSSSASPSPPGMPSSPAFRPSPSLASSTSTSSRHISANMQPHRVIHTHLPPPSIASLRRLVSARREAYANLLPAQRDRLLQSYVQGRLRRSEWEFATTDDSAPSWREHDAYWGKLGDTDMHEGQVESCSWTEAEIQAGFREIRREESDWVEYEHWMVEEERLQRQSQCRLEREKEQQRQPQIGRQRERERAVVWGGLDVLQDARTRYTDGIEEYDSEYQESDSDAELESMSSSVDGQDDSTPVSTIDSDEDVECTITAAGPHLQSLSKPRDDVHVSLDSPRQKEEEAYDHTLSTPTQVTSYHQDPYVSHGITQAYTDPSQYLTPPPDPVLGYAHPSPSNLGCPCYVPPNVGYTLALPQGQVVSPDVLEQVVQIAEPVAAEVRLASRIEDKEDVSIDAVLVTPTVDMVLFTPNPDAAVFKPKAAAPAFIPNAAATPLPPNSGTSTFNATAAPFIPKSASVSLLVVTPSTPTTSSSLCTVATPFNPSAAPFVPSDFVASSTLRPTAVPFSPGPVPLQPIKMSVAAAPFISNLPSPTAAPFVPRVLAPGTSPLALQPAPDSIATALVREEVAPSVIPPNLSHLVEFNGEAGVVTITNSGAVGVLSQDETSDVEEQLDGGLDLEPISSTTSEPDLEPVSSTASVADLDHPDDAEYDNHDAHISIAPDAAPEPDF